jgi:hypothetical protein
MCANNVFSGYDKIFSRTPNNLVFPEENISVIGGFAAGSYTLDKAWESLVARMSNKFNTGDQVAPRTNNFYLYFYLGEVKANEANVDVNGLTDALVNKMDSDFGNSVAGFDPVVDYKMPTEEDPTWYRLYKSGWLEQGGHIEETGINIVNITFPKPYATLPTLLTAVNAGGRSAYLDNGIDVFSLTTQGFIKQYTANVGHGWSWEAKGMIYKGEE